MVVATGHGTCYLVFVVSNMYLASQIETEIKNLINHYGDFSQITFKIMHRVNNIDRANSAQNVSSFKIINNSIKDIFRTLKIYVT